MKSKFILFFIFIVNFFFSQSIQEVMQSDLEKMKYVFLNKNYDYFSRFVYPEVIKMYGSEQKMIALTKSNVEKMESEGYKFLNMYFKNFNENIGYKNEIQSSFTQIITMKTPKGIINGEYTMIGISADKGKSWKFIDTSGFDEEIMKKNFPNLSEKIYIKPKITYPINEIELKNKCLQFKNLELEVVTPISNTISTVIISENEHKEISNHDGSYFLSNMIRDDDNPCKLDFVLKEISNKTNTKLKIGDTLHLEITGYENPEYYFITRLNDMIIMKSGKGKVIKKL